ncbi:LOW QUALITY PROTEIN: hypothetical protein OSB04_028078 [Centaurea solstitialis]|uniref:Uncharacterized protein n=1 Tax=Centaurea solstitialis TaxID=347529 RepID=A0AA38SYK1_9ASTR|nr:LOW QUALITY PROTEIN: hypothetical protein OSB04_028078 [Centaurea solstitialis]
MEMNCLGPLNGTYIKCLVSVKEKPRYRTRNYDTATKVLEICSLYVLTGWEGSAADGRVLHDAHLRPHGVKVPRPGVYIEFFNMKHSSARNVIDRCFGPLRGRWGILKDN